MRSDIRIDDLAEPQLTEMQAGAIAAAPEVPLDVEAVLGAASAATGLDDFGEEDFKDRLAIWLGSIKADAGLGPLGRAGLFGDCVRLASTRLKLEDAWRHHPEIENTEIDRPIVIAGLPRSGTTHLVNILASDRRLNSMPLWECMDPVIPAGTSPDEDSRYEECKQMWGHFETLLPHMMAMHEMAPDHVHEDVELMGADFSGYVLEWLCRPYAWRDHYLANDQTPHYAYAKRLIQYLTWRRGPGRWVMKSPPHMENFPALMNVYPDARVIITHRDPVAVLQSIVTMLAYGNRIRRATIDLQELVGYWTDRLEILLGRCVRDRDGLPEDRSMDVMFHDYMADQKALIRKVYALSDLDFDDSANAATDAYLDDNPRGKHGRVIYDLIGDFHVDIASLRERFQFYYDRFPVKKERVLGEGS